MINEISTILFSVFFGVLYAEDEATTAAETTTPYPVSNNVKIPEESHWMAKPHTWIGIFVGVLIIGGAGFFVWKKKQSGLT